ISSPFNCNCTANFACDQPRSTRNLRIRGPTRLAGYFVRRGLPFVIRKIATRKKRNLQITPPLKNAKRVVPICIIGGTDSSIRLFYIAKEFAIFRNRAFTLVVWTQINYGILWRWLSREALARLPLAATSPNPI